MSERNVQTVLVVGATGSVARLVPAVAERHGLTVRALVRDLGRSEQRLPGVELVRGDLEDPDSLVPALQDVDAIVLTQGVSTGGSPERIDYLGTRNVLLGLGNNRPRLAMMTALYVTRPDHFLNDQFDHVLDWRRRAERLVRASDLSYTIVRPSWFDQVQPGDQQLVFEQGDTGEGGVGHHQIADVLVQSLISDAAVGKTFELFARAGAGQDDWDRRFASLTPDPPAALDGALDQDTMPWDAESGAVHQDVARVRELLT